MQEGIQLPKLLQKIKALREAGLRAEHMAFNFMKRRVQSLMVRDTLGYQYTSDDDTSRMPGDEVDDEDIVERLGRIFKDMPPYTPCPVPDYSAARPPNMVGNRTLSSSTGCIVVVVLTQTVCCRMTLRSLSPTQPPPRLVDIPEEGKGKAKEGREVGEGDDTVTIEDTSDVEDGETLQQRFQMWSRFSRPGLPNVPLIEDPLARWRLVWLCHRGGRAMWRANASPKS
jgi:hypothetical protein